MVEAGADRPADMLLPGQLTVKQDAEVADSVGRFKKGRSDFQTTVFRFQPTERGSRAEPDKVRLGA